MRTYIIAEAGVNHNGSVTMAKQLIETAAEIGADAVKFQTFKTEALVSEYAPMANYQRENTVGQETQFHMLKQLELSFADQISLFDYAKHCGIEFLSTPFDLESLFFLSQTLLLSTIKVSSGDLTNAPLLLQIARYSKKVILSTGMSTLGEIEAALGCLAFGFLNPKDQPSSLYDCQEAFASLEGQQQLREKVILLHCTTEYPAPPNEVNLKAIQTLSHGFGLPVGYSDHTMGIHIPIAAVSLGATVIEKHFTLDKQLPGPDHKASLDASEFKAMVHGIREIEQALGDGVKRPVASEWKNRPIARKSLVAAHAVSKGEPLKLACKRSGAGISPFEYWKYSGTPANKNYKVDELIEF